MKIIITGGRGFVGQHFKNSCLWPKNLWPQVQFLQLTHQDTLSKRQHLIEQFIQTDGAPVDVVVHIGGYFVYEHRWEDIPGLVEGQISFGLELLELMRQFSIQKIIWTGSLWQNGSLEHEGPVNLYAALKKSFENLVEYYVQAYHFQALELKLSHTYGPGDLRKKLIPIVFETLRAGRPLELQNSEQKINLVYIDDLIEGLWEAIERIYFSQVSGLEKFCLIDGVDYTLSEVVSEIQKICSTSQIVSWKNHKKESGQRFREPQNLRLQEPLLPGWKPKNSLQQGLRKIFLG